MIQEWRDTETTLQAVMGEPTNIFNDLASETRVVRTVSCLKQIHVEVLKGNAASYANKTSQSLGRAIRYLRGWATSTRQHRFPHYGKQRTIIRLGVSEIDVERGYIVVETLTDDSDLI